MITARQTPNEPGPGAGARRYFETRLINMTELNHERRATGEPERDLPNPEVAPEPAAGQPPGETGKQAAPNAGGAPNAGRPGPKAVLSASEARVAPTTTPPDPFDLENLRLPQNYNETLGVKKVLRIVPVRKPNKQDYNRVHPSKEYRGNFAMIDLKDDRETYLVAGADLIAELESELVRVTLYTAINRQGVVFLWPVRLPGPDGRDMVWFSSARLAAEDAMKSWTRVTSNMSLGAYETTLATSISAEPNWPELSFG